MDSKRSEWPECKVTKYLINTVRAFNDPAYTDYTGVFEVCTKSGETFSSS